MRRNYELKYDEGSINSNFLVPLSSKVIDAFVDKCVANVTVEFDQDDKEVTMLNIFRFREEDSFEGSLSYIKTLNFDGDNWLLHW